ncbi:MAG: lipocalin family protein [Bacteroidetes bacterium]|nr:lipocalin family protein [Fibrella sp.]
MLANILRLRALFAALLLLSIAIGCSSKKDDDPTPGGAATTSAAVGNWKYAGFKVDPAVMVPTSGTMVVTTTDLFPFLTANSTCLTDLTITFKSDGTTSSTNPASCQTTSVDDDSGLTGTGKWALSNGKMTLTDTDGTITVFDATISGNTMSLAYKEDDTDPVTNRKTTYTFTIQLRKV